MIVYTITVVIPTYKSFTCIQKTLASVFAQTRLPDEVVVVDDCSPDGTVAVVEACASAAPVSVRVIRLEKNSGGPARPLNVGIATACGNLIATLDHDDEWPPNKLADQVPFLEAEADLGLVFGNLAFTGPDPEAKASLSNWLSARVAELKTEQALVGGYRVPRAAAIAGVLRGKSFVGTCSNMLFPKAVWEAVEGFDERTTVSCDLAFLAQVAMRYDLGYHPTPSAVWAIHPSSFYHTATDGMRIQDQLRVFSQLNCSSIPASLRAEARLTIRKLAFDGAFQLRQSGHHWAAAKCLIFAIRSTGLWFHGLSSLAKLLPHKLARIVRGHPTASAVSG